MFRAETWGMSAVAKRDLAGGSPDPAALNDAMKDHDVSVNLFRTLLADDERQDFRFHYLMTLTERGRTELLVPARRELAAKDLDEAVTGLGGMTRQYPQLPLYREWLAAALVARADLRTRAARAATTPDAAGLKAAAADLDNAVTLLERLVRDNLKLPGYRRLLGEAWVGQARLAADPARLELCVGRAAASFRAAAANDPENPLHPRLLAAVQKEWPAAFAAADAKRKAAAAKKPKQ
jgi:hypothetical protein